MSDLIAWAARALQLATDLRSAAIAKGMPPREFDARVSAAVQRLDKWISDSNAAEDNIFRDHEPTRP